MTARPQLTDALQAAWQYGRTPWPSVRAAQDAALRRLALHAYHEVRYYHRLFERHRLHPRHLRGAVDLDLVPITGREDLRAQRPGDLLARGSDPAALIAAGTAEGEPVRYRSWLEDLLQLLQRTRALTALGVQPRHRVALVGHGAGRDWERHGLALQFVGLRHRRSFEVAGDAAAAAVALRQYGPDVMIGAPEALDRLASCATRAALEPRLVIVEGRPPLPRLRTRLSDAFRAPVRATYGLAADTLLAAECGETGAFHVADGWALLEVLADGRAAAPGERGEVVVTLLHSYAMPVLRHRTGHVATRGGPCGCGAPCTTILAPDA